MKKFYLVMSIIFIIIAFIAIFFVFTSNGEINAGYTVIPMLITISFSSAYRKELKKEAESLKKQESIQTETQKSDEKNQSE